MDHLFIKGKRVVTEEDKILATALAAGMIKPGEGFEVDADGVLKSTELRYISFPFSSSRDDTYTNQAVTKLTESGWFYVSDSNHVYASFYVHNTPRTTTNDQLIIDLPKQSFAAVALIYQVANSSTGAITKRSTFNLTDAYKTNISHNQGIYNIVTTQDLVRWYGDKVMSQLQTQDKSSLVSAINEILDKLPWRYSMPTPSSAYVSRVIQYTGPTTSNFTQNYFYRCVSQGTTAPYTYVWEQVDVQPSSGGGGTASVDERFINASLYTQIIANAQPETSTPISDVMITSDLKNALQNASINTMFQWGTKGPTERVVETPSYISYTIDSNDSNITNLYIGFDWTNSQTRDTYEISISASYNATTDVVTASLYKAPKTTGGSGYDPYVISLTNVFGWGAADYGSFTDPTDVQTLETVLTDFIINETVDEHSPIIITLNEGGYTDNIVATIINKDTGNYEEEGQTVYWCSVNLQFTYSNKHCTISIGANSDSTYSTLTNIHNSYYMEEYEMKSNHQAEKYLEVEDSDTNIYYVGTSTIDLDYAPGWKKVYENALNEQTFGLRCATASSNTDCTVLTGAVSATYKTVGEEQVIDQLYIHGVLDRYGYGTFEVESNTRAESNYIDLVFTYNENLNQFSTNCLSKTRLPNYINVNLAEDICSKDSGTYTFTDTATVNQFKAAFRHYVFDISRSLRLTYSTGQTADPGYWLMPNQVTRKYIASQVTQYIADYTINDYANTKGTRHLRVIVEEDASVDYSNPTYIITYTITDIDKDSASIRKALTEIYEELWGLPQNWINEGTYLDRPYTFRSIASIRNVHTSKTIKLTMYSQSLSDPWETTLTPGGQMSVVDAGFDYDDLRATWADPNETAPLSDIQESIYFKWS